MTVKELLNNIQTELDKGNLSLNDEVKIVNYYREDGCYVGQYIAEDVDYTTTDTDDKDKKFLAIYL